jgi:hypothetical protein
MLFVVLLKARSGTTQERVTRRLAWEAPEGGAEAIAEYWLQTLDPAAIVVCKADHIGQLWTTFAGWDDVFDISMFPAITGEEGLELLRQTSTE